MADTDKNLEISSKDSGGLQSFPVYTGIHVYKGAMMRIQAAGYLDNAAAENGSFWGGIAADECDNTDGSSGDLNCNVWRTGRFLLTFSDSLSVANLGSPVYATDNQTATITSGQYKQKVGRLVEVVSASQGWVDIGEGTYNPEIGA